MTRKREIIPATQQFLIKAPKTAYSSPAVYIREHLISGPYEDLVSYME